MRCKLSMVMKVKINKKNAEKLSEEENFIKQLKNLTFGVRKSGKTYNMRLTQTVPSIEQGEKIKEIMRGYGNVHKTTSRNSKTGKEYNYYQYAIGHSEVKEIFYASLEDYEFKYLDEFFKTFKNGDEISSEIMYWILYTDDKYTIASQRSEGRRLHYDKLKELLEDEKKPKAKMSAEERANLENEEVKKRLDDMINNQ